MRRVFLVIAVLAIGLAVSGLSAAQAGPEASTRVGIAAHIDRVHAVVLEIATAKGLTVTKDMRFATAYCVTVKTGDQETRVCFYQDKNRTDVRIHGESQATINALAEAVRARF